MLFRSACGSTRIAVVCGLLAAVAAVGTAAYQSHEVAALQHKNATLALKITNDSAALDVTRTVSNSNAALAKLTGDSLRVVQKLIIQVEQQADAIDKALKLERRGRYAFQAQIDSLQRDRVASQSGVVEDAVSRVRRANFIVRQAPYTVAAAVALPPAPDTAHLDLRIALDPIPVVARLSCAPPNDHGIRAASIEATTPKWASVRFDDVQQSADLCASPALTHASGRSLFKFKPLMVGGGKLILPDGTSRWGGFVGIGFAIGST